MCIYERARVPRCGQGAAEHLRDRGRYINDREVGERANTNHDRTPTYARSCVLELDLVYGFMNEGAHPSRVRTPMLYTTTRPMARNTVTTSTLDLMCVRAASWSQVGPLKPHPLISPGRLARAHGCVKTLGCLATRARRLPGICTTAAPLSSSRGTRAGTCAERSARGCRTPPTATQAAAM